MATAFAKVGLSGDYGTAWLLRDLVGPGPGRRADVLQRSRRCGHLPASWPAQLARARGRAALAEYRAGVPAGPRPAPGAAKHAERNLLLAERVGLNEAMDVEVALHKECGITDDHREAVAAFVEKREPRFGGAPT